MKMSLTTSGGPSRMAVCCICKCGSHICTVTNAANKAVKAQLINMVY